MEAGACGTPSAALRVGGLPESIVDGQTGVLADTPEELADKVAALVAGTRAPRRAGRRRAAPARAGSRGTTRRPRNLAVLTGADRGRTAAAARRACGGRSPGKAAGLAAATLLNNAIQLLFTVIFTRLLGADGYGTLAALISAFLILLVAGQSVQMAAAREAALDRLGDAPRRLRATLRALDAAAARRARRA